MFATLLCLAGALSTFAAAPTIIEQPLSQTIFLGDKVSFRVEATGTAPLSYQWFRDKNVIANGTNRELVLTTAPEDHNTQFTVKVSNSAGSITSAPATLEVDFGMPGPAVTNQLIALADTWRYNVGNTNLGTTWTTPNYPDASWAEGGGLLYVEEGALPAPKVTALPVSAGRLPMTCYFRARFTNDVVEAYARRFLVNTVIDDGLVLHLNGAELFRLGMPADGVSFTTPSARTVGDAAWEGPFELVATNLVPGLNVLSAEVHQVNASSTDVVMGLTLEEIWQPRFRDSNAPVIINVVPTPGETVSTLTQVEVQFDEPVRGVDRSDLQVNGQPASSLTVLAPDRYVFGFSQPTNAEVSVSWVIPHGIIDRSAQSNAFAGGGFTYRLGQVSTAARLAFNSVRQSSDASSSNKAVQATDGSSLTHSLTQNLPGSYWLAEFSRPYPVERLELVNRSTPESVEFGGLTLRMLNMDDQVVFEKKLSNPGPGGVVVLPLPPGCKARSLWIGLPGTEKNEAGNYRVGLAEVRLFGSPNLPFGPPPPATVTITNSVRVWQSSEYGGFPASYAIDGDTENFTHTADLPDSYWMADLGRAVPISRVEIVNRSSCCSERLSGLVLRIFDASSNSVHSAVLPDPGLGETWTYTPPAGTIGRWLRVGLEGGERNGGNNYYVTIAEARVFSGVTNVLTPSGTLPVPVTPNLASFKRSYMLRLDESVPPASRANDDNYSTETKTTLRTVDGYWEVDLGATYALYSVRAIGASGIGYRLTNAIVRLYDDAHESVLARQLTGTPDVFDLDLNGPVFARYVRVGLEDKTRTDPGGGIEFYIGFREVEVFGRATNDIGIASFSAASELLFPGQSTTLSWAVEDVRRVEIRPAIGSVGASTGTNGAGNLVVTPMNSTEFILVASNSAGLFSRAVGVQVGSTPLSVRLSELVAENKYSLKDGYGQAPDWIELRNTGNAPVNLAGWGLSDDPARPAKWTFPATNVAPHSTLIVFASGRNTPVDPAGNLHANFRLEKNGGTLVLTASDGTTILDQLTNYPELDTDLAYGRDLEGQWTFLEPTPGAVNVAPTYLGWLKKLDWSHPRGFYEAGFTLTLTNQNPGATVLYSLDGSVPTLPYTGGIPIVGTKAVRAMVTRPGYKSARIQTRTFLFVDDVIKSRVMNSAITQNSAYAPRMRPGLLALPSVSISVPGEPEYEEKEGSVELLWPQGGDPVQINCGVSRFGNAWTKFAKRSFRIKCRARYGEAKLNAPLFDGFDRGTLASTSFDELDLRSGSQDMVERGFYMAARFVEDSMLDMGSLNPHGRFVHVYVNGVYWGQYDCRELLVDHFLADYLGGSEKDYVVVRGNDNVGDDFVIGTPDPPNLEPWERTLSFKNSYNQVRSSLDVSHLIDFMLLWNYGDCESEYRSCGPILPGSGFKFWIADADGFLRTSALGSDRTSRTGPGGLFGGLVAENNSDFKTLLADRIYKHFYNQGALTPAANTARLNQRMQEIHDSLLAECARWGYRSPANWESAAASIRSTLFPTRTSELVRYLRNRRLYPSFDPPAFSQYGGLVTNGFQPALSAPGGTIYYTLNGMDPRLAGGGISPEALVWQSGTITILNDTTIHARVRTAGGEWSALAQPRFFIAGRRPPTARDLLVSEIQYNPAGDDEFEFIELHNASTNTLDLSGVSLNDAVRFVFPNGVALQPGRFVLVVEDAAAFAARYQSPGSPYFFPELVVAGEWAGALDNAGETISLVGSNGILLASVPYRPGGDWPKRADGGGSSLELRRLPAPTATDSEAAEFVASGGNWAASSLYHGSPGRFDDFVPPVRFTEILSHTLSDDWVELLNTGSAAVNLAGYTLTDDLDTPTSWTFPTNAVLEPGHFMVLPGSVLGFAFDKNGEEAFLLHNDDTNVIRILDSVELPASQRDESLGLYERSDRELDFTELRASTPGTNNALPRVGPVVISKIVFESPAGLAQYVELSSLTNSPVALYDPLRPTNVWHLEGVGNFAFPSGTVLPACSSLVVCSTNPAAFRVQYGISDSIPVLGPWPGTLDRDGETLKLLRPGAPEPDGTVPYYRVDHVTYRTNGTWAAAAAAGKLERVPVQAYGNDPGSWRALSANARPGDRVVNRAPVLHVEGALAVDELSPFAIKVSLADPDAPWQGSRIWASRLPPGSSFDETSGVLTWVPTESQGPGEYTAEFSGSDEAGCDSLTGTTPFVIRVAEVNQGPSWSPQPDVWSVTGTACEILLFATDPDLPRQELAFDVLGLPSGLHLETNPLRIAGVGSNPGVYPVVVTVSDRQVPPLSSTLEFAIHLTESFAVAASVEAGAVQLQFPAVPGERYAVEWCEDLGTSGWQRLQEPIVAQQSPMTITDPAPAPSASRYYRVVWIRPQ